MSNINHLEVESVIATLHLNELLEAHGAEISKELGKIALTPGMVYCRKTGAPLGPISKNVLVKALQTLGAERFKEALHYSTFSGIDPAWLFTDPESLERLLEADPQGFAVYALNLLTGHYLDKGPLRDSAQAIEHHWAIARAWQWLSLLAREPLLELCDNLSGVLTYLPDTGKFITMRIARVSRSPDRLAQMAVEGTLIPLLTEATNTALASIGMFDSAINHKRYESVAQTPKDMARGPSQIKGMERARNRVTIDQDILASGIGAELDEIFGNPARKPNKAAMKQSAKSEANSWRDKLSTMGRSKPVISDEMISALGDFEFEADEDDIADNTVEVRTISRALLESERKPDHVATQHSIEPNEPKAPEPEIVPPVKVSLAEKIAAMRAKQSEPPKPVAAILPKGKMSGASLLAKLNLKK